MPVQFFQQIPAKWLSLSLAVFAALLRLPHLGRPNVVLFDETYYVKDGWSLVKYGYEKQFVDDANEKIIAGNLDIFVDKASFVVHPPFGKWIIGWSAEIFGMNPTGWRMGVALLGIFAVVMVHRIARRLFNNELIAYLAGFFMAIDGMAIVHSRAALLDQTLMFCVVAAFGSAVLDRDRVRASLTAGNQRVSLSDRRWLFVTAGFLGLATATKWSALWFIVVIGLLIWFWSARARISLGQSLPWLRAFLYDCAYWIPLILALLLGVYVLSWTGWLLSADAYSRDWATANPGEGISWLPESLRSLAAYHKAAWDFHVGLTSPHNYMANPWTWPLNLRPTSFHYENIPTGTLGCTDSACSQEVLALGNPLIWWAGSLAVLHQVWRGIVYREARAIAIVALFAASWLPWMFFQQRTVFSFYTIVMLPFLIFALAASMGTFLGPADAGRSRARRAFILASFVAAIVILSAFFYPLWVGDVIPYSGWQMRMWFPTWI